MKTTSMKLRIKNTDTTIKLISWIQILGGILGLGVMGYLLLQTGTINGPILLIFIIGIGLFSFCIYSGKRLLKDTEKTTALILSIINQVLQIFQWGIFGFAFAYSSGLELTVGFSGGSFKFDFSILTSNFQMTIWGDGDFLFKVNIIAILLIFCLADILNELKEGIPMIERSQEIKNEEHEGVVEA